MIGWLDGGGGTKVESSAFGKKIGCAEGLGGRGMTPFDEVKVRVGIEANQSRGVVRDIFSDGGGGGRGFVEGIPCSKLCAHGHGGGESQQEEYVCLDFHRLFVCYRLVERLFW